MPKYCSSSSHCKLVIALNIVFNVIWVLNFIVVFFLVTLFTSNVIPNYFYFIQMSIIGTKLDILSIYIMKILSWMIDILIKIYLLSESDSNIVHLQCPFFYKGMKKQWEVCI